MQSAGTAKQRTAQAATYCFPSAPPLTKDSLFAEYIADPRNAERLTAIIDACLHENERAVLHSLPQTGGEDNRREEGEAV